MDDESTETSHELTQQEREHAMTPETGHAGNWRTGIKAWLEHSSARTNLRGLGICVIDDQVSTLPGMMKSRQLGPLKGAHAEVTTGTRHHRIGAAAVAAPVSLGAGLLIGLTKKSRASAFVVFADGSVHEQKLKGANMINSAQRDVVRFNALAAAMDGLSTER
jgi:hypothetical protein